MKDRLNVLMALSNDSLGGVETYALEFSKALREAGHGVTVVSPTDVLLGKCRAEGIPYVKIPDFRFRDRPGTLNLFPAFVAGLFIFRRIVRRERIDVINVHAASTSLLDLLWLYRSIFSTPVVCTMHGKVPVESGHFVSALHRLYRRADAVVCISEEVREDCIDHFGVRDDVYIVPNGVVLPSRQPIGGGEKKVILMISRLDSDKFAAVEGLIRATPIVVTDHPDHEVWIVGGGSMLERAREMATEENHRLGREAIRLMGEVDPDEIPSLIGSSIIVVGAGRAAIEGMAHGKPVIFLSSGGLGGFLVEDNVEQIRRHNFSGRNGKEDYGPEGIGRALLELIENPAVAERTARLSAFLAQELDMAAVADHLGVVLRCSMGSRGWETR